MTDATVTKDKPDGWVAWHPHCGAHLLTNNPYSSMCQLVRGVHPKKHYIQDWIEQALSWPDKTEGNKATGLNREFQFLELNKELRKEITSAGWRIRPVKLVFLDEDKEG